MSDRRVGVELLSVVQVAEELGVAFPTVYKWIREGSVAHVRNPLSGTLAITVSEMERVRPFVRRRR